MTANMIISVSAGQECGSSLAGWSGWFGLSRNCSQDTGWHGHQDEAWQVCPQAQWLTGLSPVLLLPLWLLARGLISSVCPLSGALMCPNDTAGGFSKNGWLERARWKLPCVYDLLSHAPSCLPRSPPRSESLSRTHVEERGLRFL